LVADRLGQQLGNYRLVSLLGQGGYAEVYLGQHLRLSLQAAIKVLHAHLSDQEAEHFSQEAETIAQLQHPSIVRILDYDVQEGVPFLVMDYAPGGSLRKLHPKGSLVPLPVIISSVKQVADALQYAHEQKFIHRDVKPENMLLGRRQEVLLSDFGIATIAHSTSSLNVGSEGASGTLAYMAPEQIEGHPRAASDQYALGIVVYEWLCGERPFEGSASEVMAQHLSVPPPSLRERVPEITLEVEQVVLRALAKDPKARFPSVTDFSAALEQASQHGHPSTAKHSDEQPRFGSVDAKGYETVPVEPGRSKPQTASTPFADPPVGELEPTVYPDASTPQSKATPDTPQPGQVLAPTAAVVSPPIEPTMPVQRKGRRISRRSAAVLIGLVVMVIAGGILGSVSLLMHFGLLGSRSASAAMPVHGGTWTDYGFIDPSSLGTILPTGGAGGGIYGQALYLPLFYGDEQGIIHPGAATEVPTVQNGGISPDGKTWTFHMRPHLVWSDGAPYDARDVDYTWKLFIDPKYQGSWPLPANLITSADVSADDLSITFHLARAYAPFLTLWVDGANAPLPAHHFSKIAPAQLVNSPENLNPQVVSGPFMMSESVPGDHYTLVRNPRYYLASEGLPYLDKIVIRSANQQTILKILQEGLMTSSGAIDVGQVPVLQRLTHYSLYTPPTSASYEAIYFNLHNKVLANHLEVRQAIAMAIDHQALIQQALYGFGGPLCSDEPPAMHPGYDAALSCAMFNPSAANQLLDDSGWVRGPDGVRSKDGQRLEFEYSTAIFSYNTQWRLDTETIIQRNMKAIGIKLDIQNYNFAQFFNSLLPGGKASPPTGALAGRYDIAEFENGWNYDPDDSSLLSCDQIPPNGYNVDFYCNPALDALYKQELATVDTGARQGIFTQIQKIYLADLPFIVLYSTQSIAMVRKGTHNFQFSPFIGVTNVAEWWCDKGQC
jgi:peptide/nickel transport system substrate-binding protein